MSQGPKESMTHLPLGNRPGIEVPLIIVCVFMHVCMWLCVCVCAYVWCQLQAIGQAGKEVLTRIRQKSRSGGSKDRVGEGKEREAPLESPWSWGCQLRKLQIATLDSSELLVVLMAVKLCWGVVH